MSTAKQLNRNVVTQGIKETNFPQKSNQSAVPRGMRFEEFFFIKNGLQYLFQM